MANAALRRAVAGLTDPPDAALVRRFTADRSGEAFAALVRRHGPLVLGVCRRIVPDAQVAEDAFQAVFVVLARRAAALDPARPLGAWLHGVAIRVAQRARTMHGRRRKREVLTAAVPDRPHTAVEHDDASAVLDEEIGRLPAAAREAVVLCELQGLSRRDAPARLGVAEGTLSSRLAAARKTLAARLRSRGVVLSAAAAVVVPAELAAAAVRVSVGGAVPAVVASLSDGASAMTLLTKLKAVGTLAVLGLLLAAGGFGPWRANETVAAPVPKPKPDGDLLWVQNDITFELKAYSPDGTLVKEFKLPEGPRFIGITPDGRKIAFAGKKGKVADPKESDGLTVHLRDVGTGTEGTDTGLDYQPHDHLVWSADAGRVVRGRATDPAAPAGDMAYSLYDLGTRKLTDLKLPTHRHVMQWSPDGTWLLIYSGEELFSPNRLNWSKFHLSDGKVTPIATHFPCFRADLSPDGRSLIGYAHRVVKENGEPRHDRKLVRVDVTTGVETPLSEFTEPTGCGPGWGRWSPDGNRLAFWCDVRDTSDDSRSMHLSVCDADTGERNAVAVLPHNAWVLLGWFPAQMVKAPVPKPAPPEGVLLAAKLNARNAGDVVEVIGPDGTSGGHLGLGELDNVQQVRVSPDGKRLAFVRFVPLTAKQFARVKRQPQYAYPQSEVYVVDLPVSGPPKEPLLKELLEPSVAWAADGQSLFVSRIPAGTDTDPGERKGKLVPKETVRYDLGTKKEAAVKLPEGHAVLDASADGKTLLTGTCVWDPSVVARSTYLVPLDTLKPKLLGEEDDGFDRARLSPDGTRVVGTRVAFSKSKEVGLFVADVAKGTVTQVPVAKEVADGLFNGRVAWAPDGKRLAALWAGPSGKPLPGGGGAPGGGGLAKRITVLDATGGNAKPVCEFADDSVLDIEWADPKLTAPKEDDPKARPAREPIKAPVPRSKEWVEFKELFAWPQKSAVTSVAATDSMIAVGEESGRVGLFDGKTGTERFQALKADDQRDCEIGAMQFTPDGAELYAVQDGQERIWKVGTGKPNQGASYNRPGKSYSGLSADCDWWLERSTRSPQTVALRERPDGPGGQGFLYLFTADPKRVTLTHAALTPDATRLATVNRDGVVRLYAVDVSEAAMTERAAFDLPAKTDLAALKVSADGKRVAAVGEKGFAAVYDADTGKGLCELKGHFGRVGVVAFTPDGKQVATACGKTVRVFDAKSGKKVSEFEAHADDVTCLAFTPDGKKLVTGSKDRSAKVWKRAE